MHAGGEPDEVQGNKDAQNLIKIQYCGGWGYRRYAVDLVSKVETNFGAGQFKYEFYMDPGVTGRLEVTLITPAHPEGVLLHSKAQTKAYVHADYPTFFAALEQALSKWEISLLGYNEDSRLQNRQMSQWNLWDFNH